MPPPVQVRSTTNGLASSLPLAFSANNAPGNCLIVCHSNSGPGGDRITDSLGNTYGADVEDVSATGPDTTGGISSAPNCKSGANTITASGAGSQAGRTLTILEYENVVLTSPFDQQVVNTGFGASLTAGASQTLSQANELAIGFALGGNNSAGPYSFASGFVERTDLASGVCCAAVGDNTVASKAGVSITVTASASSNWACLIATYKLMSIVLPPIFRPFPYKAGQPAARRPPYR